MANGKNWNERTEIENKYKINDEDFTEWIKKNAEDLAKENGKLKLTAAFAMIKALDRAIHCGCVSDESVFDSRRMPVL